MHKLNSLCRCSIKRLFPVTLFFVITYAVFTPSSLFLENINEFSVHYIKILPVIVIVTFSIWISTNIVGMFFVNKKLMVYYGAFLFSITTGIYIQSNFLNPKLSSLDGTEINWDLYSKQGRISIYFWILDILMIFFVTFRWKEKTEQVIKYISYFLSAVQVASLLILLFTNKLDDSSYHGFAKEGEFVVGSEENIVLFVVDTLQAVAMEEYIISDTYAKEQLQDFTFFNNAVSGGAPTHLAMPVLLTGVEYDTMQMIDDYTGEMWEETTFYNDLHEKGYDVRFYTELEATPSIPEDVVDNYVVTGDSWVGDYLEFGKQLYKLVNFYVLPQYLKESFWISSDSLIQTIKKSDNSYRIDDVEFYKDMQTAGKLDTDIEKAFRLYHLNGVHAPYNMNENLEKVKEDSITEQQQLQGIMKEIYTYIGRLKETGTYEASTIIITGDHGRHETGNLESNPAVLIKFANEAHVLKYNSAPIHFRNVIATMAKAIGSDYSSYGPSVYDITENSDVERLHTINKSVRRRLVLDESVEDAWFYRFIIPDKADVRKEYHIWNPYNINRISYNVGDTVDYTIDNNYAKQVDYRLYKENGTAIASNELSICFELEDYQKEDLSFHFVYSDVYNGSQKIRLYANGNKIENIICLQEDAGAEKVVMIPKDMIKENLLVLRMVFPNAVTPNQIDRMNPDTRVLSVAFDSMWLEKE